MASPVTVSYSSDVPGTIGDIAVTTSTPLPITTPSSPFGMLAVILYESDGVTPVTYGTIVENKVVRPSITVDATPDYSDGDDLLGLITLTDFARADGSSGTIVKFLMRSKISITGPTKVYVFDSNPTASTFTKNSALVIHANDADKILAELVVAQTDWVAPTGTASPWYTVEAINPGAGRTVVTYQCPSGRDLWFAIEVGGTLNFAAATDFNIIIAAENV